MNIAATLMQELNSSQETINKARAAKTAIIDKFLDDILDTCSILHELWLGANIEARIKKITSRYDSRLVKNSYKLVRSLSSKFPIFNDDGDAIVDNLTRTNADWIIESSSSKDMIQIEFNPIDNDARHPTDPENNPYYFIYKMPTTLHKQLIVCSKDEKTILLTQYFNAVIDEEINKIDSEMATKNKKLQDVSSKLASLDLSDPIVAQEIKRRLDSN